MSIHIETLRFLLREVLPTDEAGMFELDSDPEVHRYIGTRPVQTLEESAAVIAMLRQQYTDNGIARWAVVDKSTGAFIGWTGFKLMREPVHGRVNHYDFGYRLIRKYWGQGIATETGRAALEYGIQSLGLKDIYAMTDIDNKVSRHVLEKLGFRLAEIFPYDGPGPWRERGAPTTWYELAALEQ